MGERFEACKGCRFWVALGRPGADPGARVGACRRHPPPGLPPAGGEVSEWPRTAADHWCGDWAARGAEPGMLPDWEAFLARLSIRTRNCLLSTGKGYWPVEGWSDLLAAGGPHLLARRNFRYGCLVELIEAVAGLGLEVPPDWLNAVPKWVVRDGRPLPPAPGRVTRPAT